MRCGAVGAVGVSRKGRCRFLNQSTRPFKARIKNALSSLTWIQYFKLILRIQSVVDHVEKITSLLEPCYRLCLFAKLHRSDSSTCSSNLVVQMPYKKIECLSEPGPLPVYYRASHVEGPLCGDWAPTTECFLSAGSNAAPASASVTPT